MNFVFITTLDLDRADQRLLEGEGLTVLEKPFRPEELLDAIERAADGA